MAGLADGLLTGGLDTTVSILELGTLVLMRDPAARAAAAAPDRVGPLVEEMLRYVSVVQVAFPRFARVDTEIGGQRIGAGEMVVCLLSGRTGIRQSARIPNKPTPAARPARTWRLATASTIAWAPSWLAASWPSPTRRCWPGSRHYAWRCRPPS